MEGSYTDCPSKVIPNWNLLQEHCSVGVYALGAYALTRKSDGRKDTKNGFESHSVRMPLDKAFCPHLSLSTQV